MGDVDTDIYRTRVQDGISDINDSLSDIARNIRLAVCGVWLLAVGVVVAGIVVAAVGG